MKSFFDQLGRIGEILAPVAGSSSTFFLAIQNHNNVDVQSILMNSTGVEMARANENGYSSIHCACRYNNMFAVDLIMSQGVAADFPDLQGNTPLHYAARYGHLDLCRILVERGCFAGKKNDQGQTAYDTTESHTVRQYLLPLQFQSERGYSIGASACNVCNEVNCQIHGHAAMSPNYLVQTQHTYNAEQHQYAQQNQYQTEQYIQHQQQQQLNYVQSTQEQQHQYAPSVHIPQAPRAGGLTINQSNSISTPISPPILTDNQPMNLPINIFHRNDVSTDKRSMKGPPSLNSGMSTPQDTATNSTASSPAKPGNNPHNNAFQHQIHNAPIAQNLVPSSIVTSSMSPHSSVVKAPNYSVPPSPGLQLPQQIPQNPHTQTPPNRHQILPPNPHQQAPSNQHHQIPSIPAPNPHLQLAPSYAPPPVYPSRDQIGLTAVQTPPVIQQAYKPAVVNSSINRIIMPDGFHTSASDPELQRKYGHTKNVVDIAPPPIFNAGTSVPPVYGMYNTQPAPQTYVPQSGFNNMPPPQAYGWQNNQTQKHQ